MLSWEAGCIQSLENHLLVGCSLVRHKLGWEKLSGSEGNSWVSCVWTPDTPFSAGNEGGHEHWPRTICISGCCSFGSAFYLICSASSRARQGLQKITGKQISPPASAHMQKQIHFMLVCCWKPRVKEQWCCWLGHLSGLGTEGAPQPSLRFLALPQIKQINYFLSQLLTCETGITLLCSPGILSCSQHGSWVPGTPK